ncbi:hypothetical protein ESCO_006174 [Escovopsis weberi]|uniref:Heterokaryon incompatibility domain-containing protein n=1 Tax=Escovopsis weberi TaxID=150374 RepID=A0A0M8MWW5_ESCWE|nr:hypothetical protein ESCO_006174 [Escovopsis weberi]
MRCSLCSGLSVEGLVDLARREFSSHYFPSTAFYKHHSSFKALAKSADAGCDLCRLIADCFKGIRWDIESSLSFTPESWEGPACDPKRSAFATARALDASDVRIAINTSHLYAGEPLKNALMLNSLLVQAVKLKEFRIGRFQVDPDLRSTKNFDIARSWLAECRTHKGCFTKGPRKLPARVVDTGPLGSPMRSRVFVTRGAEDHYIALSHCWGGRIPTLLTSKTYDDYQRALPYGDLPANFQDAFLIARELGIRYIWIDSLCIIQDSKSDWEVESKKMADIYRNATLTVSALVSPKSTAGILKRCDGHLGSVPKSVSLKVYRDQARTEEVKVEWKAFEEENLALLDDQGALNKRGWCLQEYILSPSNLLFGNRQIYWKCCAGSKSADAMPDGNEFPFSKYSTASSVIYSSIPTTPKKPAVAVDKSALLEDYYSMAEGFSRRSLTFASDKLPAFSGIARSLHPALGMDYVAGVWTADLCYGLLWRADTASAKHVDKYRAPTWSWMASDEPIIFDGYRLGPSDAKIKLVEHAVNLEDKSNPYGLIVSSHMVLRGPTRPLLLTRQPVKPSSDFGLVRGTVQYDEPPAGSDSSWYLHDTLLDTSEVVLISTMGNVSQEGFRIDPKMIDDSLMLVLLVQAGMDKKRSETVAHGLVLRQAKHKIEGAFERIGFVRFWAPDLELFKRWDDSTLVLV